MRARARRPWVAVAVLLASASGLVRGQSAPPAGTPVPTPTRAAPADTIRQAAMRGDLEAVRRFVAADPAMVAAPGLDGISALGFAAALGRAEVAAFLLEHGADVNGGDCRGVTPRNDADRPRSPVTRCADARWVTMLHLT
jgi:hypothetical protein